MIWFVHKTYTPEYYAAKMDEIRKHVRTSTRCMIMVGAGAVALQFLFDVACIYCL